MRYTKPAPAQLDLGTLDALFRPLHLAGFTGLSCDGSELHIEFPERTEPFTAAEQASIEKAIASYVYAPSWDLVRAERLVRFAAHDSHMAKAERALRLATAAGDAEAIASANAKIVALDAYGQALADVTDGADPLAPNWPLHPW